MSAHWGVENNGRGQLGTLSAKHQRDLCLPEKVNMHISLCRSQKLSYQCCFMGDSQLYCQAFNSCELESAVAHTCKAHLDGTGGKSNSFQKNPLLTQEYNNVILSLSVCFSSTHVCAHTHIYKITDAG